MKEPTTTTMRCGVSTRQKYMLFKIQSKAKNIDEILKKAIILLKKEVKKDGNKRV